jgi:asparagine synthase (glutamine-hydrolysing)
MKYKKELKQALIESVKNNVKGYKNIALALSGGIDSSVIAKILKDNKIKFKAYSVCFECETIDTKIAEKLANKLNLDFEKIIFKGNYESLIKRVTKITKKHDPITIGVGMPLIVIAEKAIEEDIDVIISGLGSDEILAGYGSHTKALEKGWKEVQKECEHRIKEEVKKDIERDQSIGQYYNIDIATPFMDKKVIDIALKIHPKHKISKHEKKIILKQIAKEMDLPKYIYERSKKAAQYGSGSHKIIKKLSKKAGFDTIKQYLESVYKQIYKKQQFSEL